MDDSRQIFGKNYGDSSVQRSLSLSRPLPPLPLPPLPQPLFSTFISPLPSTPSVDTTLSSSNSSIQRNRKKIAEPPSGKNSGSIVNTMYSSAVNNRHG